jgi:5-formyltetrahydrofolate cyclo-ligase
MDIAEAKKALRVEALARRASLVKAAHGASARMAENFLNSVSVPHGAIASAYVAIGDEPDPTPLTDALRARGHKIALPRVVGKGAALAFHLHEKGAELVPGLFGLSQPGADWPQATPDVLIVPLLAFDAEGDRLGYGAGFYDRTLRALRSSRNILAVGFALAGLEVARLPHHDGDEKLDMMVTERYARSFKGA